MSSANTFEQQMLALINQERTSRGYDPLQLELNLNESSEDHSSWMLQTDTFSHTGAGGSSAGQRMDAAGFDFAGGYGWGENIALQSERGASGYADDVVDLHNSLMNSSGHRANILNPNYEVIGIGIEIGNYNGFEAVIVTQNFAYTSGALDLDVSGSGGSGSGGSGSGGGSGNGGSGSSGGSGSGGSVGAPPVAKVDTITLDPGGSARVSDAITIHDSDGDSPTRYKIKDSSGLFEFTLNGRALTPQNKKYTIDASDMANLRVTTDALGARKQLTLKVEDEDGWGPWEQFNIMSTPLGNRPLLGVENMVFGVNGGRENLQDSLTILDRNGDDMEWFELLDTSGRDNFIFNGRSIDASTPYRVAAADIDDVFVRGETSETKSFIKIRASDGDKVGVWETFTLHTVAEDDPLLIV
ncbi:MAG: CAP domain-containing protein [Pseudomonadota bacterium]